MSRLMHSRLRLFAVVVTLSAAVGILDAWLAQDLPEDLPLDHTRLHYILQTGAHWLFGASLFWAFEIFYVPSRFGVWIRHMHFLAAIAVKSAFSVAIVVFTTWLGQLILAQSASLVFLIRPGFHHTLSLALFVIVAMQTGLQVTRIIGARNLVNFVLGRYRTPVREDTIFMFLDLADSTPLAERLGDEGVQAMITSFFFDIAKPIVEHGGAIHRYVGDQVVVTWPLKDETENLRAVECCFAIRRLVESFSDRYRRQFGAAPEFRIGLHGGPVVISQIGDHKQELSYFGDTVNTAARIEQQCKALSTWMLISGELLQRIRLPATYRCQRMSTVQLRGRKRGTDLFTIAPA
ncbi:MAG: adenylate/guanylate cyclase domain-containing protein [Gammaproteobacteria bacterium]|nr:adenylate/guanylate cyclase domain-containing protein [Gammaproteobacteria bacterium]